MIEARKGGRSSMARMSSASTYPLVTSFKVNLKNRVTLDIEGDNTEREPSLALLGY